MPAIAIGKGYVSPLLFDLYSSGKYTILEPPIYCSSEEAVSTAFAKIKSRKLKEIITILKDKFKTRELIRSMYKNLYFNTCSVSRLQHIKLPHHGTYVVKPRRGFFNIGVRIISSTSNLSLVQKDIYSELQNNTLYSDGVLSRTELIVEEYIPGEEIAVDMFFDGTGKPRIINIYHHPIPSNNAYLNVLYYTSFELFNTLHDKLIYFFKQLSTSIKPVHCAVHAEFKLHKGTLVPIELNPMRFGGFGLCDLTYFSFGVNPYKLFLDEIPFDWRSFWKTRERNYYGWVLGYNGTEVDVTKKKPDHKKYKSEFSKILKYRKIDNLTYPVFSIAYIEEKKKSKLDSIVTFNFNSYFK